jgi:hypothetical protein
MTDVELLEKHGWTVECQLPFEISHEDGSFATLNAAQMVLRFVREEDAAGGDEQKCSDPADVVDAVITRLTKEPELDKVIQSMSVSAYDCLDDDLFNLIARK